MAVADSPVSGATTTVTLWSTATWTQEANLASFGPIGVADLAFSPDGTRLAIGLADGAGGVWSIGDARRGGPAPRAGVADQLGVLQLRRAAGPSLLASTAPPAPTRPRDPRCGIPAGDHVPRAVLRRLGGRTGVVDPGLGYADVRAGVLRAVLVLARRRDAEPAPAERRPERPDCRRRDPNAAVATPEANGYTWTVTVWSLSPPHVIRTFHDLPIGPVGIVSNAFMNMTGNGRYLELGLAGKSLKTANLRTYDVATGCSRRFDRSFPAPERPPAASPAPPPRTGVRSTRWWTSAATSGSTISTPPSSRRALSTPADASRRWPTTTWAPGRRRIVGRHRAGVRRPDSGHALFQLVGNPGRDDERLVQSRRPLHRHDLRQWRRTDVELVERTPAAHAGKTPTIRTSSSSTRPGRRPRGIRTTR